MNYGRLLLITLFALATCGLSRVSHADALFPIEPICGDGAVNAEDETCDDGNLVDGDGCDHLCKSELIFPIEPECGNSILVKAEECDDGNLIDGDGCDHLCKLETKAPEVTAPNHEMAAAIVSGTTNIQQADVETGKSSGCSIVETNPSNSPFAYYGALLLLLSGMPRLLRKRR